MEICEEIKIERPIEVVYQAFANIKGWAKVLTDVLDVDIVYKDPLHEEFLMTVERNGNPETVRSIRFTKSNESIEIFQPEPPPKFEQMSGKWLFESSASGSTKVIAIRNFVLKESEDQTIIELLRGFLSRNLQSFKTYLELG